jgi:hypothetical protein
MAVQLNGKATEKQRKYLGFLSNQGKEKLGKDFSVRKIAEDKGINWEEMTQEEASQLIDEVKKVVDGDYIKEDFTIDLQEEIQKDNQKKQEAIQSPASPLYTIQVYAKQEKLQAVKIMLEAMDLDFVVLQEIG